MNLTIDYSVLDWCVRVRNAERAGHLILSQHESSKSRIVLLEDLSKKLSGAPVDVQSYFQEAVSCAERELFRAAVVLSWAGHFGVYFETLYKYYESAIRVSRPKWSFHDSADLRENYPESQLLDMGKEVKLVKKAELRILHGQLSQRNQCAHPTMYQPSMNVTVAYLDQMIVQSLNYLSHTP